MLLFSWGWCIFNINSIGAKESEKVESIKKNLNKTVKNIFEDTEQLRDGRWMWIRILEKSDIDSLILLLNAKRKPKNIF